MKTPQTSEPMNRVVSLYKKVDEILKACESALAKRVLFINEIPRTLSVSANPQVVSQWMTDLQQTISNNPQKDCIRISAKRSDQHINLIVKPVKIEGFRFSSAKKPF